MKPPVLEDVRPRADEARALDPLTRLETLCDPGTLRLVRTAVEGPSKRSRPGDGVVVGSGRVGGRTVYCYAQDSSVVGGSLGASHADSIVRVMEMAARAEAPIVGFVESGGARMDEGVAALAGYGKIFRAQVELSGRVPQISVVSGTSAGGGAYSPALADFVVMAPEASMFLTGPGVVNEVMGEDVTGAELGGPEVHARNGVSHLSARSDVHAVLLARELLGYLSGSGEPAPPGGDDPAATVPSSQRKVYDVREVVAALVDDGRTLETNERFAKNMVTALGRIEGRSVGFVCNQPKWLGGVIDADAAQKAARFVRTCDAFGIPLVVLMDTPGFLPGTRQEQAGVIRHGAKLLHAFAEATVPRMTVVLRKGYGGGFITMNSLDLGADLMLAWPDAQIGVVGAAQAVKIIHRRDIAAADDPEAAAAELAGQYEADKLGAEVAAREGFVDELVEPADTRDRLAWALAGSGAEGRGGRDHGNIPL
ncbi:MAG TPA: carboxyl transferase domain-containing protein [Thermoleophilaceae bacterium]|nr:carboxyl transferase domain-containing protein [Thermoleophilaceae bacterium]